MCGSIYCYGVVKLKSDLGLCYLIDKVFKGFFVEKLFIELLDLNFLSCIIEGKNVVS